MNSHPLQSSTRRSRLCRLALVPLGFLLLLGWFQPTLAGAAESVFPSEPQLRLNPAMHTAMINRVDLDRQERFAVTASDDKSVLLWDLESGQMRKRLRLPAAEGHIGKAFAVAMSPDGEQIAVGGWTGKNHNHNIYIYQRNTGVITHTISGLENVIDHLAYSPDGRSLAATLGGPNGLRVYDTTDYQERYADREYENDSFWASWQGNDSLVTSSYDGKIRLYQQGPNIWTLVTSFDTGAKPHGLAVLPDGTRLAVGFYDDTDLLLLKLPSLKPMASPPTERVTNGTISNVSWSDTGDRLWAGGLYDNAGYSPVLGWKNAQGQPVSFPIGSVANNGIVRNNTGFHTVPGFKTPVKWAILVCQIGS